MTQPPTNKNSRLASSKVSTTESAFRCAGSGPGASALSDVDGTGSTKSGAGSLERGWGCWLGMGVLQRRGRSQNGAGLFLAKDAPFDVRAELLTPNQAASKSLNDGAVLSRNAATSLLPLTHRALADLQRRSQEGLIAHRLCSPFNWMFHAQSLCRFR